MALQVEVEETSERNSQRGTYTACICAWCGTRLGAQYRARLGERLAALMRPVSHGLCGSCKARLEQDCAAVH